MRIIYIQSLHDWKNIISLLILIACITCCQSYINFEGRKTSIIEFNPEHQNSLQYNVDSNIKSKTRDGNYKSIIGKFVRTSRQYDTRDVDSALIKAESSYKIRQLSNKQKLLSDVIIYNKERRFSRSKQLDSLRRFNEANDKRRAIQKYSLYLDFKVPGREQRHFSRSMYRQLQFRIAESLHSDHSSLRYTERFNKPLLKYRRLSTVQYNNDIEQNRFRLRNRLLVKLENQFNLKELTRVQRFSPLIAQSNIQSLKYNVNQSNLNKNSGFNFAKHAITELNKNELHAEDKFLFMTFVPNKEPTIFLQITNLKISNTRKQVIELSEKRNRMEERKTNLKSFRSDLHERKDNKRQVRQDMISSDQRRILNAMLVQRRQIPENSYRQKRTVDRRLVVRNKILKNHTDRIQNLNQVKAFRNAELNLHLSRDKIRTVNFRTSNDMPNSEHNNLFYAFQSNSLIQKLVMNQTNLFTEAIKHLLLIGLCALYASNNLDKKNTFLSSSKNQLHLLTGV